MIEPAHRPRRMTLPSVLILLAIWLSPWSPAVANPLDRLFGSGRSTGAAEGLTTTLDRIERQLKDSPEAASVPLLGAAASQEGHWTFVNRVGERLTAAGPTEVQRVLTALAPASRGGDAPLSLIVTPETIFRHHAALKDLPRRADLRLAFADNVYRLERRTIAGRETFVAEVEKGLLVTCTDLRLFSEARWQLSRPLEIDRLRVLSLDVGGPETLSPAARLVAGTKRAEIDRINPFKLPDAIRSIRRQTAVITGRVAGTLLYFQSESGPEQSVILADIVAAAAANDVDLVLLRSSSSRQPGARNWLWQRGTIQGFDAAIVRPTVGQFVMALGQDQGPWLVTPSEPSPGRVAFTITPTRGGGSVGDIVTNTLSELTGRIAIAEIDTHLKSAERRRELSFRVLPGIPSLLQLGYVGLFLLGIVGIRVSWRWWRMIWPSEQRDDYQSRAGYLAAAAVRWSLFATLFLPIAAVPAAVAGAIGWIIPNRRTADNPAAG